MKKFFFVVFIFSSLSLLAQINVEGVVVDNQNEPLSYVNISVNRSNLGTTTDEKGKFQLRIPNRNKAKLEFSFIGFKTVVVDVSKANEVLRIVLEEESNDLHEVLIVSRPKKRLPKKQNPAYKILKEIWANKKVNGLKLTDYYQYERHQTIEVGMGNVDSTYLKKVFKTDFDSNINKIKFDDDGINFYIPFFLNETVSQIYGNTKISKERQDIVAEKTKGVLDQGFIFDRMVNAFIDVDIYQDNFIILNKSFVSPVSQSGFDTYDYVLNDSITDGNKKKYNIHFFPRRNQDFAFEGNFWVEDKSYSITKIKMKAPKDMNMNFVRYLRLEKEFEILNDSVFLPKRDFYFGDFTLLDKNENNRSLSISKNVTYADFEINKPKEDTFYDTQIEKYSPKQFEKSQQYWDSTSTKNNEDTYKLIDKIKNTRKIRSFTNVINAAASGFINLTPNLQMGPFWTFFAQNEIEGLRIKAGFRTFTTTQDRFRLNGYTAYGTKDETYKFGVETKYLLSYKPRITAGVAYVYDFEQLASSLLDTRNLIGAAFGTNALLGRGDNFYLSKVNKVASTINYQITPNFLVGLTFTRNQIESADTNFFKIDYLKNGSLQNTVTDVTTDLYLTYTPGRFVYGLGVEQQFGKNLFPTFILNYKKGYENILGGSFDYHKVQFSFNKPFVLGKYGIFDATLEGGKIFNTVPLTLLSAIPANQTFSLVRNTFSLLNYYDFVTDTYLSTHIEHHFNGLIMNRIPLIKHLDLRSLLTFRAAYGSISQDNININQSSIIYNAPNKNLYFEYGFGFENIGYGNLKFLRIDAIWRSDYKQVNTAVPQTPNFAIRIGITPGM